MSASGGGCSARRPARPSCHSPTPGARRLRSTGTRLWPISPSIGSSCRCSACAAWRSGARSTGYPRATQRVPRGARARLRLLWRRLPDPALRQPDVPCARSCGVGGARRRCGSLPSARIGGSQRSSARPRRSREGRCGGRGRLLPPQPLGAGPIGSEPRRPRSPALAGCRADEQRLIDGRERCVGAALAIERNHLLPVAVQAWTSPRCRSRWSMRAAVSSCTPTLIRSRCDREPKSRRAAAAISRSGTVVLGSPAMSAVTAGVSRSSISITISRCSSASRVRWRAPSRSISGAAAVLAVRLRRVVAAAERASQPQDGTRAMIGVILLRDQFGHDRLRAAVHRAVAHGACVSAPSATCSAPASCASTAGRDRGACSPATTGRRRPWPATTVC